MLWEEKKLLEKISLRGKVVLVERRENIFLTEEEVTPDPATSSTWSLDEKSCMLFVSKKFSVGLKFENKERDEKLFFILKAFIEISEDFTETGE